MERLCDFYINFEKKWVFVAMKNKKFLRYFVSILLAVYMLAAACLPAAAFVVEGATDPVSNLPSFSLEYEDGVLSLRLNAELLYEVISDKKITKDEIGQFLPEDVLALFENGQKPSVDELREVLSNYLTVDELREMVNDLPIDLAQNLVDLEMITNIITIDELMSLVDIEGLLEGVSDKALLELVKGKPLELMLDNEKVIDTVIENIDMSALLKDGLMDDEAVSGEVKRQLENLLNDNSENSKRDALLNDILKPENKVLFDALFASVKGKLFDNTLIQALQTGNKINFSGLTQTNIEKLQNAGVLTVGEIKFSALAQKIDDDKLLAYLNAENKQALAKSLFDKGYIKYADIKDMENVVDTSAAAIEKLKEKLAKIAVEGYLKSFENLQIDTNVDNWSRDEMLDIVDKLIDVGALSYQELIDWGVIHTDANAVENLKNLLAEKAADIYFPNGKLDADAIKKLFDDNKIGYEDLLHEDVNIVCTDLSQLSEANKTLLKRKLGQKLADKYLNKTLTEADFEELEDAGLAYNDLIDFGLLCTNVSELPDGGDALKEKLSELLRDDPSKAEEYANKTEFTKADFDFLKANGLTYGDLITCGVISTNMSSLDDDAKNTLKERLGETIADEYLNKELTQSDFETLEDEGLGYQDLIDCGVIDVSDEAKNRLKNYLIDRLSNDFVTDGKIDTDLLEALLDAEENPLTYEELLSCGVIPGNNGEIDETVIDNVKENFAKKAVKAYFNFDVDGEWTSDTVIAEFQTWLDSGKIKFADIEEFIHFENVDPSAILEMIGTEKLVAYVKEVKGEDYESYDAFAIAMDFYRLHNWTFDDLKNFGIVINIDKLTFALITETGLMDDATIKAVLMDNDYIGPQKLVTALFAQDVKASTLSTIAGHIDVFKPYVDFDALIEKIGPQTLVSKIGIGKILTALGGFKALFSTDPETGYFTQEQLTELVKAIGTERIENFVKTSGITEKLDVRALLSDILDLVKSKKDDLRAVLNEIRSRALTMMQQDIVSLRLNGEVIYTPNEDVAEPGMPVGSFDLNQILFLLLDGLPDINDFLAVPANGDIVSYVLQLSVDRNKYPDAPEDGYTYGFKLGFLGDPTELQKLVEDQREVFEIIRSEFHAPANGSESSFDLGVSSVLPATFSVIYREILESDRASHLREIILNLPTMTLSDAAAELESFEVGEFEELADILDSRSASLREKLSAALDKTGVLGDRVEPKVDAIMEKLTSPDGLHSLFVKTAGKLRTIANGNTRTLDSFYNTTDNKFHFETNRTIDLYEKISSFVELPEEILGLFGGAEGLTVRARVTVDLGIEGIHRIETVTLEKSDATDPVQPMSASGLMPAGQIIATPAAEAYLQSHPTALADDTNNELKRTETNTYYLTEGTNLSLLADILDVSHFIDANGNLMETVPSSSTRLYDGEFVDHLRNITFNFSNFHVGDTPIEDVTYTYMVDVEDATPVEEVLPELPAIPLNQLEPGWIYYWGTEGETTVESIWAEMADKDDRTPLTISLHRRRPVVTFYDVNDSGNRSYFDELVFEPENLENNDFNEWMGDGETDKLNALFFDVSRSRYYNWEILSTTLPDLTVAQDYEVDVDLEVKKYTVKFLYAGGLGTVGLAQSNFVQGGQIGNDFANYQPGITNTSAWDLQALSVRGYSHIATWPTPHFDNENVPMYVNVTYDLITYWANFYLDTEVASRVTFNIEQSVADRTIASLPDLSGDVDGSIFQVVWAVGTPQFPIDPIAYQSQNAELQDLHFYANSVRTHYRVTFVDANGNLETLLHAVGTPTQALGTWYNTAAYEYTFKHNTAAGNSVVLNQSFWSNLNEDITIYVERRGLAYQIIFDAKYANDNDDRYDDIGMTTITGNFEFFPGSDVSSLLENHLKRDGYEITNLAEILDAIDWNSYSDQTVTVKYKLKWYTLVFVDGKDDASAVKTTAVDYHYFHELSDIRKPSITTENRGYSYSWEDFTLKKDDVDDPPQKVYLNEEKHIFTATFVAINGPGAVPKAVLRFSVEGWEDPLPSDWNNGPAFTEDGEWYDPGRGQYYGTPYWSTVAPWQTTLSNVTIELVFPRTHYLVTFMDEDGNPIYDTNGALVEVWYKPNDATSRPNLTDATAYPTLNPTNRTPVFTTLDWNKTNDYSVTVTFRVTTFTILYKNQSGTEIGRVDYTPVYDGTDNWKTPNLDWSGLNVDKYTYDILEKEGGGFPSTDDATDGADNAKIIEVKVEYTAIQYPVIFKYGDQVLGDGNEYYTAEAGPVFPALPTTPGYTFKWKEWSQYTPTFDENEAFVITVDCEPITYYAIFMANGAEVARVPYNVTMQSITPPDVPAKTGYTGKWSEYTLGLADVTVTAQYTPIVYTATFVADGKVVGTAQFTVEDTVLTAPAVPEKAGYTGAWEAYTIKAENMTINAVYTPVAGTDTDTTKTPDSSTSADDEDEGGCKTWSLWIILAVLCVGAAAFVVLFLMKKRNDHDDHTPTPPAAPTPEPTPVAEEPAAVEPEPAPKAATAAKPIAARYARSSAQRAIVNLGTLNECCEDGEHVTLESLKAKGVVSAKDKALKVLATGTLTKALTVEADDFSGSAKALIEAAGGTAIEKH